jgi:hypothetical protein
LKANQESTAAKVVTVKELEKEIVELKETSYLILKEKDIIESTFQKAEMRIIEQNVCIETLENERKSLKEKNQDLTDELFEKIKQIEDIEVKTISSGSQRSLDEELSQLHIFTCKKCTDTFMSEVELRKHDLSMHVKLSHLKSDLRSKISSLEVHISQQKVLLTSSIFKLKMKENKERQFCKCKTFCRITHQKHNFIKSKSDEFFSRLSLVSSDLNMLNNVDAFGFGARRKHYTCNKCEAVFHRQDQMKKHMKHEHKPREVESGEVGEIVQTGRMS